MRFVDEIVFRYTSNIVREGTNRTGTVPHLNGYKSFMKILNDSTGMVWYGTIPYSKIIRDRQSPLAVMNKG